MRSAFSKRDASSLIFSHVALSDGVIASPETPLYLAPIASASNSGSDSVQTSSVSTTRPATFFWYSRRKESMTAMDADRSPLGEVTIFKIRISTSFLESDKPLPASWRMASNGAATWSPCAPLLYFSTIVFQHYCISALLYFSTIVFQRTDSYRRHQSRLADCQLISLGTGLRVARRAPRPGVGRSGGGAVGCAVVLYIGGGPKFAFIVDRQRWSPSSFPQDDGRLLVRV